MNINLGYRQVGGAELVRNTLRIRLIALLVITPLLLSSQLSPSHAAAKAGAKCQKVGIQSVVGTKTFTCIKSGKKLVWNKGVLISTKTPNKTTLPMSAGVKAALTDLDQYPKNKEVPQKMDFRFGPNADKRLSDLIVKNSNATMKFFTDFYQSSIPYPFVYSSSTDKDWAIAEMAKIGVKLREWNDNRQFFDPADGKDWNGSYMYWFYKEDWSVNYDLHYVTRQDYVSHHVVHGIQNRITGGRDRYLGVWAREGGATFYSWYIIGKTYPEIGDSSLGNVTYSVWRSEQTKPIQPWYAPTLNLMELNETQWLSFIKSWDCNLYKYPSGVGGTIYKPCPQIEHQQLAYSAGAIMYERLVGEFGHKKVMDWWYEIRTTPDWEEAFLKTFKINVDDWYKKSAIPYLMQVYRYWVRIPPK